MSESIIGKLDHYNDPNKFGFSVEDPRLSMLRHWYFSPLEDGVYEDFQNAQAYKGPVSRIATELWIALGDTQFRSDKANRFLHPPRLIRAVLDYQARHGTDVHDMVVHTTNFALDVYRGSATRKDLQSLVQQLSALDEGNFVNRMVEQVEDKTTWQASHPDRNKATARKLATVYPTQNIMFIALGHGGVLAGLDIYLRLGKYRNMSGSAFYPVRFSRGKLEDKTPILQEKEMDYLREIAQDKVVVIFDEDSFTGKTLSKARVFFRAHVFPIHDIFSIANRNIQEELEEEKQKKHESIKSIMPPYAPKEIAHSTIIFPSTSNSEKAINKYPPSISNKSK